MMDNSKIRMSLFTPAVLLGVVIGLLLFIYPSCVFYALIVFITGYFICSKLGDGEKKFILNIFCIGLGIRLLFIIITHILAVYYGFGPKLQVFPGNDGGAIIGDDIGIHQRAWALANWVQGVLLTNKEKVFLLNFGEYGWSFQIYILGFLYYLFGPVSILGKCLNALIGVLTGVAVYFISKKSFDLKTAKLSCILTVFCPSLFLWSISNLKDTPLIFLLTFGVFCYTSFQRSGQARHLLLLLLTYFLLVFYRAGVDIALMFTVLVCLIISIRWNYKRVVVAGIIGLSFLISANLYSHRLWDIINRVKINQLISAQVGNVLTGGTVYKIYPERFYRIAKNNNPINIWEFMISLAKGLLSFFFRPFPWEINNINKILFYPNLILWYIMFPFFLVGLVAGLRYQIKFSIFFLIIFSIITTLLSLAEGNLGTMIRHRDMITPIYLIFSSFGIVQLLSKPEPREAG